MAAGRGFGRGLTTGGCPRSGPRGGAGAHHRLGRVAGDASSGRDRRAVGRGDRRQWPGGVAGQAGQDDKAQDAAESGQQQRSSTAPGSPAGQQSLGREDWLGRRRGRGLAVLVMRPDEAGHLLGGWPNVALDRDGRGGIVRGRGRRPARALQTRFARSLLATHFVTWRLAPEPDHDSPIGGGSHPLCGAATHRRTRRVGLLGQPQAAGEPYSREAPAVADSASASAARSRRHVRTSR